MVVAPLRVTLCYLNNVCVSYKCVSMPPSLFLVVKCKEINSHCITFPLLFMIVGRGYKKPFDLVMHYNEMCQ